MGLAIENCKGYVHVFGDGASSRSNAWGGRGGFYRLDPEIKNTSGARALIMGVGLEFQEIVQPVTTLDDRRFLYLFGTAWNELTVQGLLLLGDASTSGAQLTALIEWYNSNRVSQKEEGVIDVSLGDASLEAYVVGLSLGQANPSNNSQSFAIRLVTTDVDA